jgi:hypothetical protein
MGKTGPHWHKGEVHLEFKVEAKALSVHSSSLFGSITALPSE